MMDTLQLILDSSERIFSDHCTQETRDACERGEFATSLWRVLEENGLTGLGLPESGTSIGDVYRVVGLAGQHALPVPLGECLLGRWLMAGSGESAAGTLTGVGTLAIGEPHGVLTGVPWARHSDWLLVASADETLRTYRTADCRVDPQTNMAGEPRDVVDLAGAACSEVASTISVAEILEHLAALRVVQMSGCIGRVLQLALEYAQERVQFGRPIAKFQAIQHQLAVLAGEAAAASRAADGAVESLGDPRFPVEVALAKSRVGEAAGIVAEIAHQVHGAMGFTHEHQLHHYTRRLWAWRDEYGNESFWQQRLGRRIAASGADRVWEFVASY